MRCGGECQGSGPRQPQPEGGLFAPLEDEAQWASEGLVGREPMVNRVSPLVTPQLSSVPMEVGGGPWA